MEDTKIRAMGTKQAGTDMDNMYLNFSVSNEIYGIEIKYVLQIIGMQEITEMPEMPYGMKGVINLRGNIIPVVSMRLRFKKQEDKYSDRTCIIIVQMEDKEIGLIVDAVKETITVEPDHISQPPSMGEGADVPYVLGIARLPNERIAVLLHIQNLFIGHHFNL